MIDQKTIDQVKYQMSVEQAFLDGKQCQVTRRCCRPNDPEEGLWFDCDSPHWDWITFNFRINPELELLPCPFCNREANYIQCAVKDGNFGVRCAGPGCGAEVIEFITQKYAATAWNKRYSPTDTAEKALVRHRYCQECEEAFHSTDDMHRVCDACQKTIQPSEFRLETTLIMHQAGLDFHGSHVGPGGWKKDLCDSCAAEINTAINDLIPKLQDPGFTV